MMLWIKAVQGQAFWREIQQLSRKDTKLSLPLIHQLRLYLDDNAVLCCRGRLESATLDDQSQFPVLLPRNEHFTKLLALVAHMQVLHSGVRETLAHLRQNYWVPRGCQFQCGLCWPLVRQELHWRPTSHESLYCVFHMCSSSSCPFRSCGGSIIGVFHSSLQEICQQTRCSRKTYFRQCEKTSRTVARGSHPCLVSFWRQRKRNDT